MRSFVLTMILASAVSATAAPEVPSNRSAKSEPSMCEVLPQCPRVECGVECWEIRVHFTGGQQEVTGGLWGTISGARCYAEQVGRSGFWKVDELQPTFVPPAQIELVQIDHALPASK